MVKKTLIVVDMQNDFIDMALGTTEAVSIVPRVKEKIQEYISVSQPNKNSIPSACGNGFALLICSKF